MTSPKDDALDGKGKLRIQTGGGTSEGSVDLGKELAGELEQVHIPAEPDDQVASALQQLRDGTKEGLSSEDHKDLGVAFMQMGLVDDAVREFQASADSKKIKPKAKKPARKAPPKKPAKKVAESKPAKKSARKPALKKAAKAKAAKNAVRKPAPKKAAKAKAAKKPARKPAKQTKAKRR